MSIITHYISNCLFSLHSMRWIDLGFSNRRCAFSPLLLDMTSQVSNCSISDIACTNTSWCNIQYDSTISMYDIALFIISYCTPQILNYSFTVQSENRVPINDIRKVHCMQKYAIPWNDVICNSTTSTYCLIYTIFHTTRTYIYDEENMYSLLNLRTWCSSMTLASWTNSTPTVWYTYFLISAAPIKLSFEIYNFNFTSRDYLLMPVW